MSDARKQLKPWEQKLLEAFDELRMEAVESVEKYRVKKRIVDSTIHCEKHRALGVHYDPAIFRMCPICANDRIVDEYEDAVKILFDLQDIDFQIFHLIFDTYEGVGNREDRKKSENDLIAAWRMKEAEVMSRIKNVRNCYVGVFQEPPQGIQVSQIS